MSALIEGIRRRMMLLIGRAVIAAVKSDGGRVLVTLTQLDGEAPSEIELAEPWGFTSIPLSGSEAVTLSVMGERGNRVALSLGDRRHRPKDGKQGESFMFDDQQQQIAIRRGGIFIKSPLPISVTSDARVDITAPTVSMTADVATINDRAIATVDDLVNVQGGSSSGLHPIVTGVGVGAGSGGSLQ